MPIVPALHSVQLVAQSEIGGDAFDFKINVGNILTTVTILVSVAAILLSMAKDRRTRERDLADKVRSAAARTLAKLERWQELALSFYVDVRPFFVDTAKMLSEKFDPPTARTFLWRNLENARLGSLQRIRQEDIETAYVDLYAFNLSAYDRFRSTIDKLKEEDERLYRRFVEKTQAEVLALEGTDPAFYEPTALGNTLRATCEHSSSELDRSIGSHITPLREFLAEIIAMDDQELLRYRD